MNHFTRSLSAACLSLLWLGSPALALKPKAAPPAPRAVPVQTLSQRLAAGEKYVLVTRRDLFPRPSQGNDRWIAIEGYYVPRNGTWTSSAVGFPTPGTPWHSCPKEIWCGGVHERGMVLERWYRPEQHEMVVIGQKLIFDEQGRVFHDGRQIGLVFSPNFQAAAAPRPPAANAPPPAIAAEAADQRFQMAAANWENCEVPMRREMARRAGAAGPGRAADHSGLRDCSSLEAELDAAIAGLPAGAERDKALAYVKQTRDGIQAMMDDIYARNNHE